MWLLRDVPCASFYAFLCIHASFGMPANHLSGDADISLVPTDYLVLSPSDEALLRDASLSVTNSTAAHIEGFDNDKLSKGEWKIVAPRARGPCAPGKKSLPENKKCVLTLETYRTLQPQRVFSILLGLPRSIPLPTLAKVLRALLATTPDFRIELKDRSIDGIRAYRLVAAVDGNKALAAYFLNRFKRAGLAVSAAPLTGSVDAGTLRYQRTTATGNVTNQSHAVEFNHCVGRVGAYSGSFLVTREHLSRVDFSILQHLEGICMSTFGAADYGLKASDWHDFFINHISEWEHWYKRQSVGHSSRTEEVASLVANECGDLIKGRHLPAVPSGLVVVPFWGGSAEDSGGNSHSEALRHVKFAQGAGTVCSAMRYFGRAAVGVCSESDAKAFREWFLHRLPLPPLSITAYRPRHQMDYGENVNNFTAKTVGHQRFLSRRNALVPVVLDRNDKKEKRGGEFSGLPPLSSISIIIFDCYKGVHLPYLTMGTIQSLVRAGGGWDSPPPLHRNDQNETRRELLGDPQGTDSKVRGSVPVDFVYYTEADHVTSFRDAEAARAVTSALLHAPNRQAFRRSRRDYFTQQRGGTPRPVLLSTDTAPIARGLPIPPAPFPPSHKSQRSAAKVRKAAQIRANVITAKLEAAVQEGNSIDNVIEEEQQKTAYVVHAQSLTALGSNAKDNHVYEDDDGDTVKEHDADKVVAESNDYNRDVYYVIPQRIAMRMGEPHFKEIESLPGYSGTFDGHRLASEGEQPQMTLTDAVRIIESQPGKLAEKCVTLTNACVVCPEAVCPPIALAEHQARAGAKLRARREQKREHDAAAAAGSGNGPRGRKNVGATKRTRNRAAVANHRPGL